MESIIEFDITDVVVTDDFDHIFNEFCIYNDINDEKPEIDENEYNSVREAGLIILLIYGSGILAAGVSILADTLGEE